MIIALSGPSGIGKGYFKKVLKEKYPNLKEFVWFTTRELRPDELSNSNRVHVSGTEFKKMEEAGEFVLVQRIFGHAYAVKRNDWQLHDGVFLTEIHPNVIDQVKEINPNIYAIGMITDDVDLLRERLTERRKTESPAEIEKRIAKAEQEMKKIQNGTDFFDLILTINYKNEHLVKQMAEDIADQLLKGCV